MGTSRAGLPMGLQLVGRASDEARLLALGRAREVARASAARRVAGSVRDHEGQARPEQARVSAREEQRHAQAMWIGRHSKRLPINTVGWVHYPRRRLVQAPVGI